MRHSAAAAFVVALFAASMCHGQQIQQASAQASTDIQKYAPYNIALFQPNSQGGDVVLPFMTKENHLTFFALPYVMQVVKDGQGESLGRPISYGELISLIGQLQIEANQLKQENEKLWAVVGKSQAPQAVVVQTPPPAPQPQRTNNDAIAKYLLLRQLFPASKPYQLPMPTAPNNGINCTTTNIGSTAYTNCR